MWLLRALFGRKRSEREMDEELRGYLDEAARERMRAGMSGEDARRTARVEMGSLEAVKEEVRAAGWEWMLEAIWQDMRYAARVLGKSPTFAVIAVLTLGLGIGANTAIFSLINAVRLRVLPVNHPEELMLVRILDPQWTGEPGSGFTNPLWEQMRDRQDVFSNVFAWGDAQFDLAQGGAVHNANGVWVTGDYFEALQLRPAAGRLISVQDDRPGCPPTAVLSYGFWQDHYGGAESAIGTTVSLDRQNFQVIGVAPRGFYGVNVGDKFDVAIPVCAVAIFDGKNSRLDHRSWWWLSVMGRIKPGLSAEQLRARLSVLSPQIFRAAMPLDWSAKMQNGFLKKSFVAVPAATGMSPLRRQFDQPLQILMAVVGLVLLIACANIAGLMLARGAARHKELSVRQALGASRNRLLRQLLTESVMLSSAGALLGLLFARWGAALLVRAISTSRAPVFLDLGLDTHVLAFAAGVAVLTGILFGVWPAVRSTRVSLTLGMKGSPMQPTSHRVRLGARRWIVATQVALSLVLLITAGLLLRSFSKLATLDVGFDRSNVLLVDTDLKSAHVPRERLLATYQAIEKRLEALPGVFSASRSVVTPLSGSTWNNTIHTEWSQALTGDDSLAWFNYVSPGYFETLRMPLVAGRGFTDRDNATAPSVAIVNQALARKFFPNRSPLGETFCIPGVKDADGPPIRVVGLIRDAKYESVREASLPTAFFPADQMDGQADSATFALRSNLPPSSLIPAVQSAVAKVNKSVPLDFHTLAGQIEDSLVQERMLAMLSGFFGALALVLAMIGLYGTLSYLVTQRQIEFGIRMALGAQASTIFRLVLEDVLVLVAAGVAIGLSLALAATRLLRHLLFGVGERDSVTMAAAVVILAMVAILAASLPARRATKVDPMAALRCD